MNRHSPNLTLAEMLYNAYATLAGGLTAAGAPMPRWWELQPHHQDCWAAAVASELPMAPAPSALAGHRMYEAWADAVNDFAYSGPEAPDWNDLDDDSVRVRWCLLATFRAWAHSTGASAAVIVRPESHAPLPPGRYWDKVAGCVVTTSEQTVGAERSRIVTGNPGGAALLGDDVLRARLARIVHEVKPGELWIGHSDDGEGFVVTLTADGDPLAMERAAIIYSDEEAANAVAASGIVWTDLPDQRESVRLVALVKESYPATRPDGPGGQDAPAPAA